MKFFRMFALLIWAWQAAWTQRVGAPTGDLESVSVDELFSLQVTSVGRKAQELSKAPAAIFVLTAEDIRRSGATCIPEALQWVPGLTVLHLDGRSWVVSARGGARLYADKILVMIDGRSLYTPLFSGVIWDSIDVPMEDIEQIEVVRGPGAVMWGPNAVNGVINVITRHAKATKGGQVSVATGNELRNSTEARWGAAPSDAVAYRVWGKFDYRTPAFDSPGYFRFNNRFNYRDADIRNLDAGAARVGFRLEGQSGEKDQWMVQAEGYQMDRQDPMAYPVIVPELIARSQGHTDYEGGDVQAKWTHTASVGNESELQFTYSRNDLTYPFLAGNLNNLTLDYQHRSQAGEHNELYWGAGYQQYWDRTQTGTGMAFSPLNYTFRSGDVVVRDEWQFVPGRWMASAGVRIDYNSYRRVEYQPSFRLLYTPTSKQSAWVGVSRAVRAPSRFDRDVQVNYGMFDTGLALAAVSLTGNRAFRSEVERSLEAGYRVQSGQRWSVDASVFWSYYGRLRLLDTPALPTTILPGPVPVVPLDLTIDNSGAGRSFGGEIWGSFQVSERWRLTPSYSYLNETRWLPPSKYFQYTWDGTPADLPHQVIVRSQHDLSRQLKFDLMVRAHSHDTSLTLPAAVLLDARLAWRPTRSGEISLAVKDLTNRQVLDCYAEVATPAIPMRRTFVIRWTQRF
ncbi:MAG: TonB-dependent receptor plug domain-containing protein [Candidatus Sulfopaludibacter sp.]|nr:TonB-dependent receptor plug domain-containing protein [Candidatus Sulfopaludibacter sp.]